MKKRVLIINPWIYDFAAYDLWVRPLGALYIASMLERHGIEVDLIDCLDRFHPKAQAPLKNGQLNTHGPFRREIVPTPDALNCVPRYYARYGWPIENFIEQLKQLKPPSAIILHSVMTYWYLGPFKAAEIIRKLWPETPIFIGGIYVNLCYEHASKNSYGVIPVKGPFENVEPQFWRTYLSSELADIFSSSYGHSIFDYQPAWHLYKNNPVRTILSSRGCPKHCPYCASKSLFSHFIHRQPEDVCDEIEEALFKYQAQEIVFYDDALSEGPNQRFDVILENLVKLKEKYPQLSLRLPNGIFVSAITQERALLMKKAGFNTIRLGLETLDNKRQQELGAKVEPGQFEKAAQYLNKAGFTNQQLGAYILAGLPGDNQAVLETAIKAKKLGFKPCLAEFAPTPKTRIWSEAIKQSPFPLAEEPLCHNNCLFPIQDKNFSYQDYKKLREQINKA